MEESTEINSLYRFFKETNVLKRKRDISDDGNRNNKIVSLRDIGMHINIFKFIRKIFDFGCVHNIAGNIHIPPEVSSINVPSTSNDTSLNTRLDTSNEVINKPRKNIQKRSKFANI